MSDKFRNKYRIPSNRLRGWDYATNGHYYITMVTAGRDRLFGDIENGEMVLNDLGQIVYDEFFKSFELREELFLGEFVLMPDHLHAIVILDKSKCTDDVMETCGRVETRGRVETHGRASLQYQRQSQRQCQNQQPPTTPQFQRQPKSISSFVAGFKSSTIKQIDDWIDSNNLPMAKFNKNNPLWQSNYHDHIIRNETEYRHISEYIVSNPIDWKEDTLNK
jgi:REP element-mobilizing transposase RayT